MIIYQLPLIPLDCCVGIAFSALLMHCKVLAVVSNNYPICKLFWIGFNLGCAGYFETNDYRHVSGYLARIRGELVLGIKRGLLPITDIDWLTGVGNTDHLVYI